MVSFNQWLKSLDKTPQPRQITWVCGEERVLVDDVLTHIKTQLGPEPWNYVALAAGEDSERAIWNAADQFPMGGSPRVVVIRNAEKLQQWDRFIAWIKDRTFHPRTYLVLISNEERVPKTEPTPEERRKGAKPEPLPYIAAIGAKGHVIECRPYTTATSKYSVDWVQSKVRMREVVAKHLLLRSNFDLRLVRDVCRKLRVLPPDQEVTLAMVNAILSERPRDTFADALLALDRKTALLALQDIQPDDYGRTIGYLDSRLDLAGMVHDMMSEHRAPHEIARAAGAQAWLVPDIMKVAKHYSSKRRLDQRKILAIADEAYLGGQRDGILEAVVAFW